MYAPRGGGGGGLTVGKVMGPGLADCLPLYKTTKLRCNADYTTLAPDLKPHKSLTPHPTQETLAPNTFDKRIENVAHKKKLALRYPSF